MRNLLIAVVVLAVSFTPTFANPPLFEEEGKAWMEWVTEESVEVIHPVTRKVVRYTAPQWVGTFQEFSTYYEETEGERKREIHLRPLAEKWVTEAPD